MPNRTRKFLFLFFGLPTLAAIVASSFARSSQSHPTTMEEDPPNIVLLVADDMGYSDISLFGGEVETPNIDSLARIGTTFTHFYSAPTCSPARSMMLTGVDNHLTGFATMTYARTPNQVGQPGYETYMTQNVVTVPTLLQDAGYNTYAVGKWHLGEEEGFYPSDRGFDQTFSMLQGAGDHYTTRGYDEGQFSHYVSNGEHVELPADFYSTDTYTDKLISFIEGDRDESNPFFIYAAYTSPHDPLQVPDEHIEKYMGEYDMGWQELREQRFQRMKDLGLIEEYLELPEQWDSVPDWDSLTPEQKRYEAKIMATYAGMIDNLDSNIGRLIDYLKDIGEYENTVFVFLSDNGGSATNRAGFDAWQEWFRNDGIDNSYENLGRINSWISLTKGWAQASTTPFLGAKGRVGEGGVRVPAIIAYPKAMAPATRSEAFGSVMDFGPTFLDYAGVEHPGMSYEGREVYPMMGRSLKPILTGMSDRVYGENDAIAFELYGIGNSALYQGDWKILKTVPPWGDNQWKLFNLRQDPRELVDLSAAYPQRFQEMLSIYEEYEGEMGVIHAEGGSH